MEKIKKKRTKNVYWTSETEKQLRLYIAEPDINKKNAIYEKYLHKAFVKLIENIVFRYKLYNFSHDGIEDIKQQCIYHIIINIDKFDITSDYKAFSYFGTAVKNYLIQAQTKDTEIRNNSIPISSDLNDVYGKDEDNNRKMKDNNILNDISYSYVIDGVDEIKDILLKFVLEVKNESELVKTFNEKITETETFEWREFLNSFVLVCETAKGTSFIENKLVFYNALRSINNFSDAKNYKYMNMLKTKYFKFKYNYLNNIKPEKDKLDAYL